MYLNDEVYMLSQSDRFILIDLIADQLAIPSEARLPEGTDHDLAQIIRKLTASGFLEDFTREEISTLKYIVHLRKVEDEDDYAEAIDLDDEAGMQDIRLSLRRDVNLLHKLNS